MTPQLKSAGANIKSSESQGNTQANAQANTQTHS